MNNIIEKLNELTDKELESVQKLIDKLYDKHYVDTEVTKPKRRRRKKTVDKKEKQKEIEVEREIGRRDPRNKIVLNEKEPIQSSRTTGIGRTEPRRNQSRRRGNRIEIDTDNSNRQRRKVMTRTEQVKLEGENKFVKMRAFHQDKRDTAIDKLLWGNRPPVQRPPKFQYADVQCKVCKLWFDVDPGLIVIDPDTHQPNYTCNNCVGRR